MVTAIKMPQLGLTMTEGLISEWKKQEGDEVKAGDVLLEIETDKLSSEIEAEADGVLLKIVAGDGETVEVQGVLGYIGQAGDVIPEGGAPEAAAAELPAAEEPAACETPEAAPESDRIAISPYAKRVASELGVDYSEVEGTGPNGRIIERDIRAGQAARPTAPAAVPAAGDVETPMSGMRRTIARRMSEAHTEIPPVTMTIKVDVTELLQLRSQLNAKRETKLSVNDFIIKGVAKALAENRYMLVRMGDQSIIQCADVNVGMAVATDDGLIVPVIHQADRLSLGTLSAMARDLAVRARENRLSMDEYAGSTFSVTNIGMYGVETFTPIINQPDAAILGVCGIQEELQMTDGAVSVRKVMRLCLTIDHRLIDGAPAAQFLQNLKTIMESPLDMVV